MRFLTSLSILWLVANTASAQLICPTQIDPTYGMARICRVENEVSSLELVLADPSVGRDVFAIRSWTVGGVEQLDDYRVMVFDEMIGDFPDLDLTVASPDEGRDQIIVVWEDDPGGAFFLSSNFVLIRTDPDNIRLLIQHTTSNFGQQRNQTLFVYTDFALLGTSADERVDVLNPPDGRFLNYSDGAVCPPLHFSSCVFSSVSGSPGPTAFDVGLSSSFDALRNYQVPNLQDNLAAIGPADLASVQAWEYVDTLFVQQEVFIPLPEPIGAAHSMILALILLARRRRRHRTA